MFERYHAISPKVNKLSQLVVDYEETVVVDNIAFEEIESAATTDTGRKDAEKQRRREIFKL